MFTCICSRILVSFPERLFLSVLNKQQKNSSVTGFELVAIKLANIKLVSTADVFFLDFVLIFKADLKRTVYNFYILALTCHIFYISNNDVQLYTLGKSRINFCGGLEWRGEGANQTRNAALDCMDRNFILQHLLTDFTMSSNWTFISINCNVWAALTACFEKLRRSPKEFKCSTSGSHSAGLICRIYTTVDECYGIYVHFPFLRFHLCFLISTVNMNVVWQRSAV